MKKLLIHKNKYFVFLCCYLLVISMIGISLTYSKYTTGDSGLDQAQTAKYDLTIYSADPSDKPQNIIVSIKATSKMSEPKSLYDQTYSIDEIVVHNASECDVRLTNMSFTSDPDNKPYYSKLICGEEVTDDNIKTKIPEYLEGSAAAGIGEGNIGGATVAQINAAVDDLNEKFEKVIKLGGTERIYIVTWVEHDNVYNASNINDSVRDIGVEPEKFVLNVHSEQVD